MDYDNRGSGRADVRDPLTAPRAGDILGVNHKGATLYERVERVVNGFAVMGVLLDGWVVDTYDLDLDLGEYSEANKRAGAFVVYRADGDQ